RQIPRAVPGAREGGRVPLLLLVFRRGQRLRHRSVSVAPSPDHALVRAAPSIRLRDGLPPGRPLVEETHIVFRNVGSTWVLTLVTIVVTYALTPFVIHTLGPAGYGTWTLITSMTGYMGLLALGVPMASVRYLAQHVAEGDRRKTNEVIASCAGLYLMISAAAGLIGAALIALFGIYEIPSSFQTTAHLAFGL